MTHTKTNTHWLRLRRNERLTWTETFNFTGIFIYKNAPTNVKLHVPNWYGQWLSFGVLTSFPV